MLTLNELNLKIQELEQQRQDLLNQAKLKEGESIKSLKWTKDYEANLEINFIHAAGIPRYFIIVYGNPPSCITPICIMGESRFYEQNMMYGKDYMSKAPSFYTSSTEILLEFLKIVKFKRLHYTEEHLLVLQAAQQYNKN